MALQGLGIVTWFGWFSGVILLRHPWGCPSFTSWLSVSSALVPINIITCVLLLTDAYLNFKDELFLPFTIGDGRVHSLVIRTSFLEIIIVNLLIYMVFIVKAKKLATLWGQLYHHADAKLCSFLVKNSLHTVLGFLSFFSLLALAILDGLPIGKNCSKSWFSFLGWECYSIIVVRFMIGPFVLPLNFGFAVVLTTLHHLQRVYETYCNKVHEIILNADCQKKVRDNDTGFKVIMRGRLTADLKRKLVKEFEQVQELFLLSEHVLSPMILVILSGGSLRLVITAAKIVLRNTDNFWDLVIIKDVAHLMIVGCHLFLLRIGQGMLDTMNEWKGKLRQASFQLDSMSSVEAKDLKDISLLVNNWKWQLTACAFFDVDRDLIPGIISLLMAYTVILVQFRIAFEGE